MLVLSRKVCEVIKIGDDIEITVVRIGPGSVRLGITAPMSMNIAREELCECVEGTLEARENLDVSFDETRDDRPAIEKGND